MNAAGTRARIRAELTREIADVARRHLATDGAAALSLRAVAREMGMASSAVYRYYSSRDELLTALIVEAYDALGAAAEKADAGAERDDLLGRWQAVCAAVRTWAVAHPHEYALVYGSPVPGYAAPRATIGPAGRVGLVLGRIIADGVSSGAAPGGAEDDAERALEPGLAAALSLPPGLAARAVHAWSSLYGLISFELFGHLHNVVADHAAFFGAASGRIAASVGIR